MGVLYDVIPLGHVDEDGEPAASEAFGIILPPGSVPSRYPTPNEIRAVLDQLEGYRTVIGVDMYAWDAYIEAVTDPTGLEWTYLHVRGFEGDEDQTHPFFFAKGSEEIILRVVEKLAHVCGPLIVYNDADCGHLLGSAGMSVDKALRA